ncbi:hypothetical protein BJP25_28515 [Actinokineospora bangkokensis]|uniref:Plasmid pRiA4b Orf3-like domain-containing protein n=1 Tax=Actinokineospora bangkokensis TaxID=1193682 RepID=A0A1Q9LEW5_9PSEU|nr:hypothetical protein BJP25_28515 [Actinokineospora bangkokensis]
MWRRLDLPAAMSLAEVSDALLTAFGFSGEQQHLFTTPYGLAADVEANLPAADERTVTLAEALARGTFQYRYDLGDAWDVLVRAEKRLPVEPGAEYPRCVGGERAGPPEHVGGVHGYAALLAVLDHPGHPDHAQLTEFVDDGFDPAAFDLAAVDDALR